MSWCLLDQSHQQFLILGESQNGVRAIKLAAQLNLSVIPMDVHLRQLAGIGTTEPILPVNLEAKVLILIIFGVEQYIYRAVSEGASGFRLKSSEPEELLGAVLAVAEGAAPLSPRVARLVLTEAAAKGHMTAIMLKLGARNRVDAALTAYRAEIVSP